MYDGRRPISTSPPPLKPLPPFLEPQVGLSSFGISDRSACSWADCTGKHCYVQCYCMFAHLCVIPCAASCYCCDTDCLSLLRGSNRIILLSCLQPLTRSTFTTGSIPLLGILLVFMAVRYACHTSASTGEFVPVSRRNTSSRRQKQKLPCTGGRLLFYMGFCHLTLPDSRPSCYTSRQHTLQLRVHNFTSQGALVSTFTYASWHTTTGEEGQEERKRTAQPEPTPTRGCLRQHAPPPS